MHCPSWNMMPWWSWRMCSIAAYISLLSDFIWGRRKNSKWYWPNLEWCNLWEVKPRPNVQQGNWFPLWLIWPCNFSMYSFAMSSHVCCICLASPLPNIELAVEGMDAHLCNHWRKVSLRRKSTTLWSPRAWRINGFPVNSKDKHVARAPTATEGRC